MSDKKIKLQVPKCEHCGREFMPKTAWQRHCSDRCRLAAWLAKQPAKAK